MADKVLDAMLEKKVYQEIKDISAKIEKLVVEVEHVKGVYEDVDQVLNGLVWGLISAFAELDRYAGEAVDAIDFLDTLE